MTCPGLVSLPLGTDIGAELPVFTQWQITESVPTFTFDLMSILYVIFHPGEPDDLSEWLAATFGITCPPGQSRFPTPNEVRATLDALEGYTVKYDEGTEDWLATVSDARDPTYGPWTSVRMGKGGDHPQADTPQPLSFKSGSTELIVHICERLSHRCGPLIIYPDSGHEVPILVTPGIDPAKAVNEWLARE